MRTYLYQDFVLFAPLCVTCYAQVGTKLSLLAKHASIARPKYVDCRLLSRAKSEFAKGSRRAIVGRDDFGPLVQIDHFLLRLKEINFTQLNSLEWPVGHGAVLTHTSKSD